MSAVVKLASKNLLYLTQFVHIDVTLVHLFLFSSSDEAIVCVQGLEHETVV